MDHSPDFTFHTGDADLQAPENALSLTYKEISTYFVHVFDGFTDAAHQPIRILKQKLDKVADEALASRLYQREMTMLEK